MENNVKWFNPFTWFSSKERRELEALRNENKNLRQALEEVEVMEELKSIPPSRPFKSLRLILNNLVVVLHDGLVLERKGDKEDIAKIAKLNTEEEVINFFINEEVLQRIEKEIIETKEEITETEEEIKIVNDNLRVLRDHPDFEIRDNEVFMKGVELALPVIVTGTFIEILEKLEASPNNEMKKSMEDKYTALKFFWLKLALNPIAQSRLDLLNFVKKNDVRLTKNGNLILYRRIKKVGRGDKKLVEAVSEHYAKIKKNKKSPKSYNLFDDNGYVTVHIDKQNHGYNNCKGNLYDLYQDLPNMTGNSYTASHKGPNGPVNIKIGAVYYISDSEINLNNGLCAEGGLHAANVNYNYSSFGDTPVVVLVSPTKAITVPTGDAGKLRTTEMFVACINDKAHGVHFDEDSLSLFDEEYNDYSLEVLEKALKDNDLGILDIKKEKSVVKVTDLQTIVSELKNRIKEVV